MEKKYDLIIVGSGPAGLTAGIYAARYNLNFLIIGKLNGGAISEAHKICNYPSQNNITGFELTMKMVNHVKELNGEIIPESVEKIKKKKDGFEIQTNKKKYSAKKIILAIGRERQKLDIPGEKEFLGKGVGYCAICDAALYKDKIVAVAGGGNAAITAALLLAEYAKKVYIVYRKDKFSRADPMWVEQLEKEKKIEPLLNSNIKEIYGENLVQGVILNNKKKIELNGVFIEIGFTPNESLIESLGLKTEKGYIITDRNQRTSVKDIFAAGDATDNPMKQIITACAEGAVASKSIYEEFKLKD
ncbi:MAG: FAD-dependent oxidoreductase [Nanoarchaeota archaeon]|nr:FAD-dependent oxidoreductase [Nanoarchaeota archaeon]